MFNGNLEQLHTKLLQIIRMGKVTARQAELHKVQVKVADTCGAPLITDWLPVLVNRTVSDCEYDLPDIGEDVVVIFMPNGLETGFVLGGFYNTNQKPNQTNPEIYQHSFKDGTFLQYDRASHVLTADVKGDIVVKATGNADANIQGALNCAVNGAVTCTTQSDFTISASGNITITGGGNVTVGAGGALGLGSASGEVTMSGSSVKIN